jgi:uncharacterized protein
MTLTLEDLRRFTVARSLFSPMTLANTLRKMGFVQADPIRAPARAQDLILRHRVKNYRAGDLERRYEQLDIEEDFFINYGFVTREVQALMHPRADAVGVGKWLQSWPAGRRKRAALLLEFVRERGVVHPREVDAHFAHGKVENYWGGSSNATTHLLDDMHYRGLLRVVRRASGIRIYAAHQHAPADETLRRARIDALVDVVVRIYAPLPLPGLRIVVRRLRFAAPHLEDELEGALARAKERFAHEHVESVGEPSADWYWPADEVPTGNCLENNDLQDTVRLLAPFDPVVWDRARFERLWGWVYRFEAYTPVSKRRRGYYALPLLWRDRVIGWGNLSVKNGELKYEMGYVAGHAPRDRGFKRELKAEVDRMRIFLGLEG